MLIGASRFDHPDLHDLPSVANNLQGLVDVLSDPAGGCLDREGCQQVAEPTTPQQVGDAIDTVVSEALDTLVLYYAGHGVLGQRGNPFLAVTTTDPDSRRVRYSGVPMEWLRSALADSPAHNRILILDCCFSGHAAEAMSNAASAVIGELDIKGTYTLASAPAYSSAVAPVGAAYTAFTGELVGLLKRGIPGGGSLLTLGDIFPALSRGLMRRGLPQPQHLGTGLSDRIALARNAAYQPENRPSGGSRTVLEQRRSRATSPRRQGAAEDDPNVTAEFHTAMLDVYRKAKREAGYNAAYFLRMVEEVGGLEAARRLLRAGSVSSGFSSLWEKGRLDLSAEAVMLQERFAGLFSDDELEIARSRLAEYGYQPPAQTS
ncbi:caspase family protein [Actinoplanes sp. NEAU-A12]|uniref:Caspase family protein n=1 Tax=Actinoplanes sandaracinus TaxID=3045177 RepID=A0ABT6WXP4_9ACTN|nr:caspase family protein [Actinoplanes sandaracinus]MDI6104376.1 caspase family protein [Actinoplanes sandaracinus]